MAELGPASTAAEIVAHLHAIGSEENRQGMKRYGIRIDRALGISHGVQRDIAKKIRRNHERAFELWATGITEAQFIASVTADPKLFTAADASVLHDELATLPMYPWLALTVQPLATHPQER